MGYQKEDTRNAKHYLTDTECSERYTYNEEEGLKKKDNVAAEVKKGQRIE